MRHAAGMLVGLSVLVVSCGGNSVPQMVTPSPSITFGRGTAIIETDDGPVLLKIEVAQTPEQRARGLMFRRSLPDDYGMVFIFFDDTRGGFYMKNTLVPLSIAFFDVDGKILEILDMQPCTEDPCKIYDPGVSYRGALEVEEGAFDDWGVDEGDKVSITQ